MRKKYIFLLLTILWMAVIFAHSAQNAEESTVSSHRVGMWIGHMVMPGFEEWPREKQMEFAQRVDYPVRKTAHATEYAILGGLVLFTAMAWEEDLRKKKVREKRALTGMSIEALSWGITTLYACTDEWHQLYVPGRSGQIGDVCIDALGAFAGILILWLFLTWYHHRQQSDFSGPAISADSNPTLPDLLSAQEMQGNLTDTDGK